MKIEIDTETFDFSYQNEEFIKASTHYWKLLKGEDDGLNGEELLKASEKEQALNEFRMRAFKFYCLNIKSKLCLQK